MIDASEIKNNAVQKNFRRKEKKFILTASDVEKLLEKLGDRICEDRFGHTSVLSIYYDNSCFELLARSSDKPAYKEKLRVRSYGVPGEDSTVFAEIKKKYDGTVYKRRTAGTPEQIEDLLENGKLMDKDLQIQKEICYMKQRSGLRPAVFIGYDRTAYVSDMEPELRITIDSDLRYRLTDLDLRSGGAGLPLRDADFRLMEIKSLYNFPLWLTEALSELGIRPGSFSKAGTCYKEIILPSLHKKEEVERKKEYA